MSNAAPIAGVRLGLKDDSSVRDHSESIPFTVDQRSSPALTNTPGLSLGNDPGLIQLFREALQKNGFTEAGLRQELGGDMSPHLKRADLPLYERRLAGGGTLSTLLKLFTLQLSVTAEEAREALLPLSLDAADAMGLIRRTEEQVRAAVTLSFCEGLWLAHDCLSDTESSLAADHVLGPNPAAATLARLVVRRPAHLALDIGTGCGVQALLCARHCERVVATDTNPRALNYTLFNARLNQLNKVECRLGSLFEPVAGSRFDLIVCNPPFVISPASEYLFRDSGLPGDKLSEAVVRAIPAHLAEGGFASVLCSWAHQGEEEWSKHLRAWVTDNGCDAWLFHGVTQDPLSYAAGWNRGLDAEAYGECLDRWEEYYQGLGIRALSLGAVVLRRHAAGPNWLRTDKLPETPGDSFSDHLLRICAAEDYLGAHRDDEEFLRHAYRMTDDQQVQQLFVAREGKLVLERTEIELTKGLRLHGILGPSALPLLALCDGRRTLGQALAQFVSASTPLTAAAEMRQHVVTLVRQLLSCGFLTPLDSGSICISQETQH